MDNIFRIWDEKPNEWYWSYAAADEFHFTRDSKGPFNTFMDAARDAAAQHGLEGD